MIKIYDVEQGSGEWLKLHLGIPSASEFHTIIANGRNGEASKTRHSYMLKLADEILTGEPRENYCNAHMERGTALEPEARALYGFINDVELTKVGFIINGAKGCSPDSLIGNSGVLEIKSALPHILLDFLSKDEFPPAHKAQCQGELWVAEREFVDIAVYWPRRPLFVKRAYRDEAYIAQLSSAIDAFNAELNEIVERLRPLFRNGESEAVAREFCDPVGEPNDDLLIMDRRKSRPGLAEILSAG